MFILWYHHLHTPAKEYNELKYSSAQIMCGDGLRIILAVEFNWEFTDDVSITEGQRVLIDGAGKGTLWEFRIQITLTSRIHPSYKDGGHWGQDKLPPPQPGDESKWCRWAPLGPEAFRPKQYTVRLEKGRFIEPFHYFQKKPYPLFQPNPYGYPPTRYEYRLLFDKSPYPEPDEWQFEKSGEGSVGKACLNSCRLWEYREFVWGRIPKSKETWAEMLSLGWWLSPYIGRAHQ